eukprot:Pompholyxophrys_punicea_v1_NODE_323_length_2253_cov_6.816652.p1 type:complete len:106 gc:universal NODE_323_length_2253_cov_6.816652:593-910(+)
MTIENLQLNRASWHKSCCLKFTDTKIQAALAKSSDQFKTPVKSPPTHLQVSPTYVFEGFDTLIDYIQERLNLGEKFFKLVEFVGFMEKISSSEIHSTRKSGQIQW